MKAEINCPQCHHKTSWQDNPHRPFCSDRCRLFDLGQWADGAYRIAGRSQDALSEDNLLHLNQKNQEDERS